MAKNDLLEKARERLKDLVDEEEGLRSQMEDDLRFATLDQWPDAIRKDRENDPDGARPCLVIDKINQYIVQVSNDMRQNRPAIKVRPVDDTADVETAKIYQGLARHIEDRSSASVAYAMGGESAVRIGMGYWRVITRMVNRKSNEQEICIEPIPNAFSVYLGPHIMPDGSDANYGFVIEEMPIGKFKELYPKAKTSQEDFSDLQVTANFAWRREKTITVAEYFYREYESDSYGGAIKWAKMTGVEILEERDWPGKYIPIIEVIGRESYVDGRRILWGLVRPAKDSLRMNNYWMSAITEKISLAPKTPFVGAKGQFEGVESKWKNANRKNYAYLEYEPMDVGGNALPPPQRVAPAPLEVAMVNMTALIERDVKASLGMYKAAVGDTDSQQSGRAILALQKESDTGTLHFADNQAQSIRHTGRIIVDLIPKIYDTRRVVRILGEDDEAQAVQLDPEQEQPVTQIQQPGGKYRSIYNLGVGEYDVTVTVGPSYATKRQEIATLFTELANSSKEPVSAAVMRYIAVKNSDFEHSDEALKMLRSLLPPPVLQAVQGNEQIPPAVQAKMQQDQQLMQAAAQKIQELESGEQAKMAKIAADEKANAEKLRLDREKANQDAKLTVFKANLDAKVKVRVAEIQANAALSQSAIATDASVMIADKDRSADMMNSNADRSADMMNQSADRGVEIQTADADREASLQTADADREADISMQAMQAEEAELPAAEPPMRSGVSALIEGLGALVTQLAQMNTAMIRQNQQNHAELMAALRPQPKQISGKLPSGNTFTATIN